MKERGEIEVRDRGTEKCVTQAVCVCVSLSLSVSECVCVLRTVKVRLKESGLVALSSGQERGRKKTK